MPRSSKIPTPPKHLSRESTAWWRDVAGAYVLAPSDLRLLQLCCESWDRGQAAREELAANGTTYLDRWSQPRAHPAVAIERDARVAVVRCLRELALDVDGPPTPQPPTIAGRAGRRI